MKMEMKMKNSSHRYDINRPKSSYSKCKRSLSMMLLIYIKQQLSNISGSIHEKVKQHWGWVERSVAYIKKACLRLLRYYKIKLIYTCVTAKQWKRFASCNLDLFWIEKVHLCLISVTSVWWKWLWFDMVFISQTLMFDKKFVRCNLRFHFFVSSLWCCWCWWYWWWRGWGRRGEGIIFPSFIWFVLTIRRRKFLYDFFYYAQINRISVSQS